MAVRELFADRRWRWSAVALAMIVVFLLIVGTFPFGWLKHSLERDWSRRTGRPVTIGTLQRKALFSFTPTVLVRDVRLPQPVWAGKGDLATIKSGEIRFNAFAALFGQFQPKEIVLSGLRVALIRDRQGRENWASASGASGGGEQALGGLELSDAQLTYRDAKQNRQAHVALVADRAHGVTVHGEGSIAGHPVVIAAHGPPIIDAHAHWPFEARIEGDAVGLAIKGVMTHPLDTRHMTADLTAHAIDLKLIDAIIEAGLFGTQPVKLAAHAVHDGTSWAVTGLRGTIGRSDLAGHVTTRLVDGRTKIDGAVTFGQLDFDDLASDAGLSKARQLRARIGRRIVPNTRINLAHVGPTDGVIKVAARHLVSKEPSALTAVSGTLTLDHRLLTLDPFTLDLTRGRITGRITVDQHDNGPLPRVTLALDLDGSTLSALVGGGGDVTGAVNGRLRLAGQGGTFREVVGNADGRIGLFARDGVLPAKTASALGFDAGRALTTGGEKRAGLRCVAIGLAMRRGAGTLDPMVIDTTRAQSRGTGTIRFPQEALNIRITGAPKQKSVLRLPAAIIVSGTIKDPDVQLQKGAKSLGNVLKAIGQSITGDQPPRATDADCDALSAAAMAG